MARNITDNEWQILNVLTCNRCNLKTSDMALLQAHHCPPRNQQITAGVSYNLVNAKFTCSLCTVELSETEFCEHLEGHLTLKPYICKYCDRDFSTRGDVCEHLGSCHQQEEQTFVLKLTGRTKDIIQKAKNVGKVFYKPVNVVVPVSSSAEVAISKTTTQNVTTVPGPKQPKVRAPVAGSSSLCSVGSTSTVRNTLPAAISPVSMGAHPHLASQLNSNTVLTSARPQLPAEQRRYFVLLTTQPQTGSPTSSSVLQTQAPSSLSQNVCTPASDTPWRHQFPKQNFPGQIVVPMFIQRFNAQRGGIQRPATTLPNLVTHPHQSVAPSVAQNVNTRGVHVANVSPVSVNQVKNAPALTVPPVFNLNQACLSSPSVQNTPGTQLASTLMSSTLNNASASSAVMPDARTTGNPLAPAVIASTEGNNPLISADMSVNCLSPTETDTGNIYEVSIQQFPTEVKSGVESDNVNGDFVGNGSLQINQEVSSLATEVIHERSSAAVIKSEDSTDGDADTPLQIRIENIMSLAAGQGDVQQCVQDNATETVASTESSLPETGSTTTEHQLNTVGSSNFSFLHIVKGYFLCLVCHMKWLADYDSFFKHIWEKHTHGADFSCCPTGYSPYCARLEAIVKTIYDKSQVPFSDQIRSYFTPKSSIETENVQNISSERSSSAPVPSTAETVKQINVSESPSSTVPVRPSSAPHECEQILPAESVSLSNESSSPPTTLIPDQPRHMMIETDQNVKKTEQINVSESPSSTVPVRPSSAPHECEQILPAESVSLSNESSSPPTTLIPDKHRHMMIETDQNVKKTEQINVSESPSSTVPVRPSSAPHEREQILPAESVSLSNESSSPPTTLIPDKHRHMMIETDQNVKKTEQINVSESPSSTVPVRPSSAPHECEQILPAESVSLSNESSSPPTTLVPDQPRHMMIETEQNCDFGALAAGNELEKDAPDVEESAMQIGKQKADGENVCSASELRDDLNFNAEGLQNITAIDLCSSVASISVNEESNNKNTYEDISDDDRGGVNYHNCGTGNINYSLAGSPYSDELPLDLSKKTTQPDASHNSLTVTPMLAAEMATVNSITYLERLPPERIDNSHNSFIITPLSVAKTAVTSSITQSIAANPRTRTERHSTESIGMGDDDDISLRCFYGCGICVISFPTAVELEVHVQRVHTLEQNLPCAHCGFRCRSSKHLIQHMEDHLASDNRKTFSCSLLENSDKVAQFENNDMKFIIRMLKTSLAANSDNDAVYHFACNMCQSEFADLDLLGLHLQESLLKVIECKHCASFFLNTFSWQKHMAIEHVDLSRMYCIKRKLLCFERKMHSNIPHQVSQEDISCLSNVERDAETSDNQCGGTHESHATSGATANVLDEIETVASHVIENSEVRSKDVELTETHSHHEGRAMADGIEAQTTHEQISIIPNLLDLVKTSAAMRSLISAVSLNAGKAEKGAVANTGPNRNEMRGNSVAQQCDSGTYTTTISTSIDSSNNVKSALSHAEDNLTNTILDCEDQCLQGVVAKIPLGVQSSNHDNFGQRVSENINTLPYNMTVPLNDHCLNEKAEFSVVRQAEAVSEISHSRVKHTSLSVVGNIEASSVLDQATSAESQDGCGVPSVSSRDTVSCKLPPASDCSVGSKDYFNITSAALSLPVTGVSDLASTSAANFNLDMAETRTFLCVSEQNKLEHTQSTCLPVEDIGADINNRQESRHSSVVLENNLRSGVEHDIEHVISNVVKDGGDQAASAAVTGISEAKINDLLKEPCTNNRSHCTPDVISVLKTVSHDSGDIANPATNSLGPDHDSCHDTDFSSSKDSACTLQESVGNFAGNDDILENDISCGHNLLHPNIDKTGVNLMQDIQTEKQETKKDGSYDKIHYNKNSLVSTKDGQLYASNETSACIESRETSEENVLNSPSHSDNFMEENNTTSVDQTSIASNITEDKGSSHTETDGLSDKVSTEHDLSNSLFRCNCGTLISCFTDGDYSVQPQDKSLNISFTGKCAKCRLVTEENSHPDNTTEQVTSKTVDTVPSKDSRSLSEKAVENCLRKLKRKAPLISENSGKINRLENVEVNHGTRSKVDPPERSTIKPDVLSGHSETCVGPEISKTNSALNSDLETTADNGSIILSESKNTARDFTTSNKEMPDAHHKRKSEAGQCEGVITSKLLRINSEEHKPEDTINKLDRAVAVSQSPKDIQGADVAIPDSARFRCSACPFVTSQSYTELKQHVKSQHPQDKSARVCRIRSRSLQNAAEQSERWQDATLSLQEVQNNDVTMSSVHDGVTVPQHAGIHSETSIGYRTAVNKSEDSQTKSGELDKLKETVIMQEVSKVGKKSLATVASVILKSDSKPHFKCSVCIFLTSHSYTEMQQHVMSQHSDDKSAKVNRINPKCLLSAAEQFAGSEPSKEVNDLTSKDVKQYFKCSVCISLSSHSYTEMKQHILLQHAHDISAKVCRVNCKSSYKMDKERLFGIYKCIKPKCTFTRKWNLEKMKAHIESKHPYYSCGYCKAPYTILAFLYNHLKFVHRGKKPRVMNGTIDWDLLFKPVDIPYNELSSECKYVTSQTSVKRKKRSQSSLMDDIKKSEAKANSELKVLKMKRHNPLKSCDVNVTSSKQNQPLGDSKTERIFKDNDDSHSTAAQGLKTPQCKLAHSQSESIFNEMSPVPENEISSAEKPTVTLKTAAISNDGDSLSAKPERNLFETTMSSPFAETTMSSRFAKTFDHIHRIPSTVSLHTKKTVAPTLLLSPQFADNNIRGHKVTENPEWDQHSSAQNVCSKIRPLGPVPSQDTVRKDSSAATSNRIDINMNLNSATSVQSPGTNKKQELNSIDISDKQEANNRLGNVHETLPEICSETASCVSDTVLLPHTTVASVIVTPKTHHQKHCGTWAASQLETKTAAEGNENKDFVPEDLGTAHSENSLGMQNKNKTESKCENAATTDKIAHKIKTMSKHDYPFRCTACSRILKCVREVEKHYNRDHPRQDVRLTERKSGFVYSNSGKCLRWKDDKKAPTDRYMCSYCAFRNIKRSDVEDHIRRVHPERDVRVFSLCKPNTGRHSARTELTSKMTALQQEASRSNSPTPSYFCNVCSDVKNSEFQFRLHLASHPCYKHTTQLTAGASFLCHACGYIAKSSSDFVQHTGEHLSERRFKCFMCEHDSHNKQSMRAHIKSFHNKTVDDDVGIIDRNKQRNVDLRPRLVNIDPQVVLIDPFRQPNYLQQLVLKHGVKMLDLPGDFCTDILTCERDKYGKYFDINKFM